MTTPESPIEPPAGDGSTPPPPPGYGAPPPGYGQPGYGQPYGGQPNYGQPYGGMPQTAGTNGFAIASLIAAFLCSPLGIVFGLIAKSQIKQRGQGGSGLATAGIVISIVLLVLGIILAATGNATFHASTGTS